MEEGLSKEIAKQKLEKLIETLKLNLDQITGILKLGQIRFVEIILIEVLIKNKEIIILL